jgi:hypothetical protein
MTCADVCWRMLTCGDVCWRVLTYTDVCWRMLTHADACCCMLTHADVCWRVLPYADVCWRVLAYADICWRMLTHADVCWLVLPCADVCWQMLTYSDVCWRMLTSADYLCMNINICIWRYIHSYTHAYAWLMKIIDILIILDTCLIQHVYARACACMFTLSTASTDAPSSTSKRTVAAWPLPIANIKAVIPLFCQHSQVITVQRSMRFDEREHAHENIHTCQYMHIYTYTQTSPICVDTF